VRERDERGTSRAEGAILLTLQEGAVPEVAADMVKCVLTADRAPQTVLQTPTSPNAVRWHVCCGC
jgi:hypothetical protein